MDLWVVAAAAGAGYMVKANHMKSSSLSLTKTSLESLSWDSVHHHFHSKNLLLNHIRDRTCPLCRLASDKETATDGLKDTDVAGVVSSSSGRNDATEFQHYWSYGNGDIFSTTNEFPGLSTRKQERCPSNGYIFKPFSSLTAEFGGDLVRLEGYEREECPSPCHNIEWVPTISSSITGATSHDYEQEIMQLQTRNGSLMVERTPKQGNEFALSRRLSKSSERVSNELILSQGTPSGMHLFFLGLAIGVMSTPTADTTEVDSLNAELKQKENLLQDLEEELKMKDALTVKELASEGLKSKGTDKPSFLYDTISAFSMNEETDKTTSSDHGRELCDGDADNIETMSQIEAELEAELERLELNMRSSRLDTGFYPDECYETIGVDSNSEARGDVVQTELVGPGNKPDTLFDLNHEASGTTTDDMFTANYAVPAKELSLRLHEVIQSSLEFRITELEKELENVNKKLHALEVDSAIPVGDLPGEEEDNIDLRFHNELFRWE